MSGPEGMHVMVTGGSAGLGRAMVEALLSRGLKVTAIGRDAARLDDVARSGADVVAGDATDADFMNRTVAERRPSLLILNAGARLSMGRIDALSFDDFSANWNSDVKAGLHGIQAAFNAPMAPGSRVLIMSSGAALVLSVPQIPPAGLRLSGGYVGAKRMLWFMAHSANAASRERDAGLHFQVLLPTQLMAGTELGHAVASRYADLAGVPVEQYLFERYGPPLTPAHLGDQVADIVCDEKYARGVAYGLTAGPNPVGLDV